MTPDDLPPPDWRLAPAALWRGVTQLSRRLAARERVGRGSLKQAFVPFVHHLPAPIRESLRIAWRGGKRPPVPPVPSEYEQRYARELAAFENIEDVHALPPIFHYWSNRWLLPMQQAFGSRHPEDFLAVYLFATGGKRFVSLGSGNCDVEIRIAQELQLRGMRDFTIECLDINPATLARGREAARACGLEACVLPRQADFNAWEPDGTYDAVIANQSLHHMLELERVFDAVSRAIGERGKFIVSDMIGRNGHQRWPEAKAIVREFWRELPESYRYNVQIRRHEPEFIDWDCANEGFEGIRAQDILPLMLERFGFEVFLAFGNLIDPFIDRGFGPHFNAEAAWDRDFIDRVHARDEAEIQAGRLTPTHMQAVLGNDRNVACVHRPNVSPRSSLRRP